MTFKIIDFYDRNSKYYCSKRSERFYGNLTKMVCDAAAKEAPRPRLIIDIGSGSGYSTSVIAERFPETDIIAVEPAASFNSTAMTRLKSKKVEFNNCRLAEVDRRCKADLLISNMSYHWLLEDDKNNLRNLMDDGALFAMACPVRPADTPSKRFSGNGLLAESYRELVVRENFVPPAKDLRGSLPGKIGGGLEILSETAVEIIEEFPASKFAADLYYRGSLHAVFGDRAGDARGLLERRSRGLNTIEYSWPVVVRLARRT